MAMSRPEPREADGHEWQTYAPKWLLVTCVAVLVFVAGAMFTEVRYYKDREKARLDAAIADVPSKYQARLSERVAALETSVGLLTKGNERLMTAVDNLTAAVVTLNAKLEQKERIR